MPSEPGNTGPNTMGGWFRDRYWPSQLLQLDPLLDPSYRGVLPDGGGHPRREDVDKSPDAVEDSVSPGGRSDRPSEQTDAGVVLSGDSGGGRCALCAEDTDDCTE